MAFPRIRACVVAAALAACVMSACEARDAKTPLTDLEGRQVDPLGGDAELTVLVFMTTTCPISNRYAPTLRALHETWPEDRVKLWRVYPDGTESADEIREHGREYELPGEAVVDAGHRLVARSGATITPEAAVFVGRERQPSYRGRIDDRASHLKNFQGRFRNEARSEDLRGAVEALLAGDEIPNPRTQATGCYITDMKDRRG